MSTRLNVAAYRWGAGRQERAAARATLSSLAPDVLVLHRVPAHPFAGHRIAGFADHLDLMWSGGPHRRSGGCTILASLRVDVLDERHLPLSHPRNGYAVTRLRLPGHPPCLVVGAHLTAAAADAAAELGRLREEVGRLSASEGLPVAALSVDVRPDVLGRAWPDFSGGIVPARDEVTSTDVDTDRLAAG